ncbi:MAG: fibronectin type III domain-containing protein [Dehalococcoidia bacterium]|jgi:hypothetical protein
MKDRRMKVFGLFTALSLIVCLIASGIVSDADSSYAATSSLKWTRINIPSETDMQLYPGSDIGPMAVSPDGATIFAAVQDEGSGDWDLFKSTNSGFSWQVTGLSIAMASQTPVDTGDIVAVQVSPNWNTDGRVYVATENRAYRSSDRGNSFSALTLVPGTVYDGGTAGITTLALGRFDGKVMVAVGTSDGALGGEVYLLEEGIWYDQTIGAYDVLAVALSPSYASDSTIIAVVTDSMQTRVRTKRGTGGWGVTISDATFKDQDGLDFVSRRACIGLPSDYNAINQTGSVLEYFVGLSADGPGLDPLGDVFRVRGGWLTPSTAEDLNIRGDISPVDPSETNIWSIAVSGALSNLMIIVGTETLDYNEPPSPHGQALVYTSIDGGATWSPSQSDYLSSKQPTGETQATVVMTSYMAYAGTFGDQSAVSASVAAYAAGGAFSSWNQRGLIDTVIDEITDVSPSEGYFADGTIYITTMGAGDASLWRTQTEGRVWERLYCSTLTIDAGTGTPSSVFNLVTYIGNAVILAQIGGTAVIPSTDSGGTFRFDPWNPTLGNTPEPITAFAVESDSTYYAGDANGGIWKWTDDGGAWVAGNTGILGIAVVDIVLSGNILFAGTNWGFAFFCDLDESDFSEEEFFLLGMPIGGMGDIVRIVHDPYDNYFVYAGIQGSAPVQGIWRYNAYEEGGEEDWWNWIWEQIAGAADVGDISSIACDSEYGVLYAISASTGTGWRFVNPTTMKGDPEFQEIKDGLGVGDSVLRGLKLVSNPAFLFAIGGASYTQLWTTSDEVARMRLLSPSDGSVSGTILEDEALLGRAMVMLEWRNVEGATEYEVRLAFDESFVSPVDNSYYDGGVPESAGLLKVVYPWLGTRYYWQVRVTEPYMSQWSEVWSFVTPLGPAPSAPSVLSPGSGQIDVLLRPVLQWDSSVAATGYELVLAKSCNFDNLILDLTGSNKLGMDTAYQITFNLEPNTNYCWKVRGVNEITHSPWSDTGTFTTGITVTEEEAGLEMWVWVIIILSSVLILAIVVLIVRSRFD